MKKLLSLGFILVLCSGLMMGCGNVKLTEDEVEKCRKYESDLVMTIERVEDTYNSIVTGVDAINSSIESGFGNPDYLIELDNNSIEATKSYVNEVSIEDLENYHNYLVDYEGSDKDEEYERFIMYKSLHMGGNVELAFASQIMDLYNTDMSTDEIKYMAVKIDEVKNAYIDTEYETDSIEYKIREDVFNRSKIDYEEYINVLRDVLEIDDI